LFFQDKQSLKEARCQLLLVISTMLLRGMRGELLDFWRDVAPYFVIFKWQQLPPNYWKKRNCL